MGLYTQQETRITAFRSLPVGLPKGVDPDDYWHKLCKKPFKYYASKSKASCMVSDPLKVIHHILSHTIGARRSSNGVVNNFELAHIYSIDKKYKINVGIELALFLLRQATDTRTKAICCGGYITRLLQGMNIFQAPPPTVVPILIKRVLDGPFHHWGLKKIQGDSSIPFTTPPRTYSSPGGSSSYIRASTSHASSFDADWKLLRKEFRREQERNKEEREKSRADRKKNKKFRKPVMSFLHSIVGCFSPPPKNLPTYESSSEKTTSEDAKQPSVIRRPGKAPIIPSISSKEEVAGSEEEAADEEATKTDAEASGEENAEGEAADAPEEEDDDDADDDEDYSVGDDGDDEDN